MTHTLCVKCRYTTPSPPDTVPPAAQNQEVLDHPLVKALQVFISGFSGAEWAGTPTELYEGVKAKNGFALTGVMGFPKNASILSKELRKLQPALAELKLFVNFPGGHSEGRRIEIDGTQASTHHRLEEPRGTFLKVGKQARPLRADDEEIW